MIRSKRPGRTRSRAWTVDAGVGLAVRAAFALASSLFLFSPSLFLLLAPEAVASAPAGGGTSPRGSISTGADKEGAGARAAPDPPGRRSAGGAADADGRPSASAVHPIDYSLTRLEPFSGGLAAVQAQGRWGYVDRTGKVVVPFVFEKATPFDGGHAAVMQDGRWMIADSTGRLVAPPRLLSSLGRFSEGLAPARLTAGGLWGFVDLTGAFVIPPRFTSVDPFSQGLASVAFMGHWFYVKPTGEIVFDVLHYRSYPFTADGLALFQAARDGAYGYLRRDGTVAIEPIFPEARSFSEGLAPVRIGDRWGYITTTGKVAIEARFTAAFPFIGGIALVGTGSRSFLFVDTVGSAVSAGQYPVAQSYSDGVAIVGDGTRFWYVDTAGERLPIGDVTVALPQAGSDPCAGSTTEAVTTNFVAGFTQFQIVNQTNLAWSVEATDTWNKAYGSGSGMKVVPGLPVTVDDALGPENGVYSFLHHYSSIISRYPEGLYPLFSLKLTSGDGTYVVTLTNSDNLTDPPPPTGHPWWDALRDSFEILGGMFGAITGEWFETATSIYDITKVSYDVISGAVDGSQRNNDNARTNNTLVTQMSATAAGSAFSPLTGGFCGGDSYTISDNLTLVITLATVKSTLMPPTVQLTITPYSYYFAQNSLAKLDMYRKGLEPGGAVYKGYPYDCVFSMAFENWGDVGDKTHAANNNPCSAPSAFSKYDYLTKASSFAHDQASAWWAFANALPTSATNSTDLQMWVQRFAARCGTVSATCPSPVPMSASPTTFNPTADTATGNCTFQVNLSNPAGPVGVSHQVPNEPAIALSDASTCSNKAPWTSPCELDLLVAAGLTNGTAVLDDGSGVNIQITVTCTARQMVIGKGPYSGTSYPDPCSFSVPVTAPRGAVTVTPSGFVTANTCTKVMDGTCTVTLAVPPGTNDLTLSLSDGMTTQPISVSCIERQMTLDQQSISGGSIGSTCPFPVVATSPHGRITTKPPTYLGPSGCTGPLPTCQFTVNVPAGTADELISVSDGMTTAPLVVTCDDCSKKGFFLPGGNSYTAKSSAGCTVQIPVQCALPPVTVAIPPSNFTSVDVSGCASSANCAVKVTTRVGDIFMLQDASGRQEGVKVQCE